MSFPYYSDLKFGSEQASADSLGRLSFSEPVDNKDYNYKTANFRIDNISSAPEYYYYIVPTPNSEEVKREMYNALNNAEFSIVITNDKSRSCTLHIRYNTGGEYNYYAQVTVSYSSSTLQPLTIPSIRTVTFKKVLTETSETTNLASLSLRLKNASDDTDVSESELSIYNGVSSSPLVKIPV